MELPPFRNRDDLSISCLLFFFLCFISVATVFSAPSPYQHSVDGCDWTGSGGTQRNKGEVRTVYLRRCRAGRLEWRNPVGALRILIAGPRWSGKYRVCVLLDSSATEGVSLYLEEGQSLKSLFFPPSNGPLGPTPPRCFQLNARRIALFAEVTRSPPKGLFAFDYDLQIIRHRNADDECRPCSERELLSHFCSADFIIRGAVESVYDNIDYQQTELLIKDFKIIRSAESEILSSVANNTTHHITLHRPLRCGTKAGSGEFLFLGHKWLSSHVILCAPRWTEWKKVRRKALSESKTDCLLN